MLHGQLIFFFQNSSCYISIESFLLADYFFDKQPYPQNVWQRHSRAKCTVLQLTAERHQNFSVGYGIYFGQGRTEL